MSTDEDKARQRQQIQTELDELRPRQRQIGEQLAPLFNQVAAIAAGKLRVSASEEKRIKVKFKYYGDLQDEVTKKIKDLEKQLQAVN